MFSSVKNLFIFAFVDSQDEEPSVFAEQELPVRHLGGRAVSAAAAGRDLAQ